MLKVETKLEDGKLYVAPEGEIDTTTTPDFQVAVEPLLTEASSVIMDFKNLQYISSTGLRILVVIVQTMEEKGGQGVRIINLNNTVREILEITGFDDFLLFD